MRVELAMPTTTNLFRHIKDPITCPMGNMFFDKMIQPTLMYAVIEGEVDVFVQGRHVRLWTG